MKKSGLNGYAYDFNADYDATAVDDLLDICKYLMKRTIQYKMFGFIEKCFYRFFGCNILSVNPLKFVSMNNQECNVRPKIININSNESLVVLTIILMIHMQNYVFLMLLKT